MDENVLQDALNMACGVETLPPSISPLTVDNAATQYATWMFQQQAESPEDEEVQLAAVRNAIAAAYIAGCLDTMIDPAPAVTTVATKSGTIINIYA